MPDSVADQGGRLIGDKRLQKPQGPVDRMKSEGMRRDGGAGGERQPAACAAGRGQQAAQGEEGGCVFKTNMQFYRF
jgi:hypothetical protein